jgi:NADH-quinone oxidoreductase subunit C
MAAPATVGATIASLREALGEALLAVSEHETYLELTVTPMALHETVTLLRETLLNEPHSFCDLCGVEREESLEVVCRLSLISTDWQVAIKVPVAKDAPSVPSLAKFYAGALWPEREAAEMFGFHFEGHPDLRPLLLPEGWDGYPLRKDYQYPLEHPYLRPDPLRDDPVTNLSEPNPTEGEGYEGRCD